MITVSYKYPLLPDAPTQQKLAEALDVKGLREKGTKLDLSGSRDMAGIRP